MPKRDGVDSLPSLPTEPRRGKQDGTHQHPTSSLQTLVLIADTCMMPRKLVYRHLVRILLVHSHVIYLRLDYLLMVYLHMARLILARQLLLILVILALLAFIRTIH